MSLSSITPMPRIISPTISIVGYKYERRFQRLVDDLINYNFLVFCFLCELLRLRRAIFTDSLKSKYFRPQAQEFAEKAVAHAIGLKHGHCNSPAYAAHVALL